MFDFNEELKKFEPSADADLSAVELKGEESADMLTILKTVMMAENEHKRQVRQMDLEDLL